MTELQSRAIRAGYNPPTLHAARVLVVGLGALGQNTVQDLALSGVGQMILVDPDDFEAHNATRSPFYPSHYYPTLGLAKAPNVAYRARCVATAPCSDVMYCNRLVQVLGDGVVRWADVVVAAVDDVSARAWLAERSRLYGKPLIEGGFSGPRFNLSTFSGESDTPCYRCANPERVSSASCTNYALQAEAANIIPAIQTAAAVLGGLQAEQVIQVLHGAGEYGKCLYGNVRHLGFSVAQLQVNPHCPGYHEPVEVLEELEVEGETLGDMLRALGRKYPEVRVVLSEPLILTQSCTVCLRMCVVQATESAWLYNPRCTDCGGVGEVSEQWSSPRTPQMLWAAGDHEDLILETKLDSMGLHSGACLLLFFRDGKTGAISIGGNILDAVVRPPLDLP